MADITTKKQLIENIARSRRRLEEALSSIPQENMTQGGVQGDWSVKDLLDHIVVWEGRMLGWLATTLEGKQPQMLPDGMTWDDLDRWNQETYKARREHPLGQVLEDFQITYPKVLQAVKDTPEELLFQADRFPWRKGSPLWEMVAANTVWHYDDHAQAIEQWLSAEASSNQDR
jgi:hypothetical protein